MKTTSSLRTLLFLSLSFIIIWSIGVSSLVHAHSLEGFRALTNGAAIENDLFVTDQRIVIDRPVNGDVFVLGNQVQVQSDIDGSLFALGQNVEVLGNISGTTYVAAMTLNLGPESMLERNLYFIGGVLTLEPGAVIQRDLNTVALDAKISGQIGRTTNAMIGVINLAKYLFELLSDKELLPSFGEQTLILPSLGSGAAHVLLSAYRLQGSGDSVSIDWAVLSEWLIDRLRDFGLLLLLGAVCYWLFRSPLERGNQALRSRPLAGLGYGLLALLITSNLFLVGALVAALLFVLGLWIGYLGLWSFAIAFWILAYAALVFIMAVLWFIVAYGTKLLVAYLIGNLLFDLIRRGANIPRFVALTVGVLIYVFVRSIPMAGWVFGVLVTAWGLGAIWLAYFRDKDGKQIASEPEGLELAGS
jgi:hypothetical protein